MRSFGSGSIIAVLCVAILFVFMSHPSRENVNAQQIEQTKAEIAALEDVKSGLVQFMDKQNVLNSQMHEFNKDVVEKIAALNTSLKDTRDVVKLTSLSAMEDSCTCGEKLADLQKQIDELKSKVATLEQAKTTASAAAASSSYGSATPVKSTASGGSTGSVKSVASGGSTGSVRATSGGSTGSSTVYYSQPVTSSSGGHWTYPGSIDSHLAGTHGVDVSGMSREQMLNLHDSLHESTATQFSAAPVRQRSVTRQSSVYAPTSDCPGGVCPTPASGGTRRGGLLGFGILRR